MKKSITNFPLLLIVVGVIFITSCSETDPLPISKADFKITSVAPEIDVPIQFENLSLNAAAFSWDYGDGSFDTLLIDPSHTYESPGAYTVKMTAYTEDGQKSEALKDIDVGQRYLTGMYLVNINMKDPEGNPWDDDGSGPDVTYILFPEDESQDDVGFAVDSLNVGQFNTPLWITDQDLIPADYELSNKNYIIWLAEFDTEGVEETRTMVELAFNPKLPNLDEISTTKNEDGAGDIAIPFVVSNEYQFYFTFQIR